MKSSLALRAKAAKEKRKRKQEGRTEKTAFELFQEKYRNNPRAFVLDCFLWNEGQGPTPYQLDILDDLIKYKRIAIRGPHGLGKTAMASWIILWFCLTRDVDGKDWKAPLTASVWRQLSKYLFPEVHKWTRRLDWKKIGRNPFDDRTELLTLNLKLTYGEAFCLASNEPTALEGVHADSVLYVLDESKAIIDSIWDSVEGAFSTGNTEQNEVFVLAISTPGLPIGRFYDIHRHKEGYEDWHTKHVTLKDAVQAGRITQEWADQRKRQWGEKSAAYQQRVLGEFSSDDQSGVIPLSWIERAIQRWNDWVDAEKPGELETIGIDVAGATEGSDDTCIAKMYTGYKIDSLITLAQGDINTETMRIADIVADMANRINPKAALIVDVIGLGSGTADRLYQLGYHVLRFVASLRTDKRDKADDFGFADTRSAAWWQLREMLDPDSNFEIALPPDATLIGELTCPTWHVAPGAKIRVESKDKIRKRIQRSTDRADAVIQAITGEDLCDDSFDVEILPLSELANRYRKGTL